VIVIARRAADHVEARVMVAWVAAALGLFGYGYVARAPGTILPSLPVPGFHFFFYRDGRPFTVENGAVRQRTFSQFESGLTSRLRGETPPGAVVLAPQEYSLTEVAPSGRSVVAVPATFSNPYVPFVPRARDQDRLLAALMARDSRTFVALARARGVTHVVLGPLELFAYDQDGTFSAMEERSRQGRFALFAVRLAENSPRTGRVE
jgi:hypothetical protein